MRSLPPLFALVLLVAGCSGKSGEEPAAPMSSGATSAASSAATGGGASATATASARGGVARSESVSNDRYEFEYSYPAAAGTIPDLKTWLDADLEKARAEIVKTAQGHFEESRKEGFPFNPLSSGTAWKVVADLPGWLSLSADLYSYEGGAHPNHGFTSMIWDRQANARRMPADLFASREALSRAIRAPFCREIDKQRAKKRGEPVKRGSDDMFSDCLDPVTSTLILGSSNGKAFDRIGVLVGPYEAGPYVEGDYEVTLPVTDTVMAAVKPEYRATFVKGR